ncbi:MAG: hypothetical protein AB8H86_17265 [Polyangiales bacterium]
MFRPWSNCRCISALCLLMACAPEDTVRVADVELRFSGAASCRPMDPIDLVVVEALGDFAASDARTIEILRPSEEPGMIDRFPFDTAALVVRATTRRWEGVGIRYAIGESTAGPMLLLPLGQDCAIGDPALASGGAALVPTPDGGALVVAAESQQVLRLGPGETLAQRGNELSASRLGAAVALEGEVLIVAGGGVARETFEVFDIGGARVRSGALTRPRREASALGLGGGEVLVLGGRGEDDATLAGAEILSAADGTSRVAGAMPIRRAGMSLVRTDDGAILALGGVADGDNPVGDVVAYDRANDEWELLDSVRLPALPDTSGVALPGGRVAVVASSIPGRSSSMVRVLRRVPPTLSAIPTLVYDDVLMMNAPPLREVRATALPDGRLFVSGRDDAGAPRAFAFDVGRARAEELAMSDTPDAVATLADGVVLSTSPRGASMRRVVARTPFHQAPATLLADDFALDAEGRFDAAGTTLRALVSDARADLATLRFADFRVEFAYEGSVELLLRPEGAAPVRVVANSSEVGPALCTLPRTPGRLYVQRRGDDVTLGIGESEQGCRLDGLGERVGVGFRLSEGSTLTNVSLVRE